MMDKKIDWKNIGESGLQVMSYAIGMVVAWLLFALTTILIVIDYVNDFQYLGLGIFIALLVEAIATWIVAVVLTIKLDNITKT
jgi:coronavirus M matrix/glycoprotein